MVEIGSLLSTQLILDSAAQQGARVGITGSSDAAITSRIDAVAASLNSADLAVTIDPASSARTVGTMLTVSVTYADPLNLPLVGVLLGGPLTLHSALSMRME